MLKQKLVSAEVARRETAPLMQAIASAALAIYQGLGAITEPQRRILNAIELEETFEDSAEELLNNLIFISERLAEIIPLIQQFEIKLPDCAPIIQELINDLMPVEEPPVEEPPAEQPQVGD